MSTLNLNDVIQLDDGEYRFLEHSSSIVRLANTATGRTCDMHVSELARRIDGLPPVLGPAPRDFGRVSDDERQHTSQFADHIEEILTGTRLEQSEPTPEYNPEHTTQEQRLQSKLTELAAAGQPSSRATLMRAIKAYRKGGRAELLDKRKLRNDARFRFFDEDLYDCLTSVINNQVNRSTGTKSRLIHETYALYTKRFGALPESRPHDATMYRYIEQLTAGKHTTGSAKTRRSAANRPDRTLQMKLASRPGEEIHIDSTPMDILVRAADGTIVRPTLTMMLDKATRSIMASTIRLSAKGVDHCFLLAQALTPPQNRPDKSAYRQLLQQGNPHITLLPPSERQKLERSRPFIRPHTIVMDNGKDFTSDVFMAALERHHVHVITSAPHTPTDKPLVERHFHSINTLFLQYLPGYISRSPEYRGYKVEEDNLLTIDALYELFDDWVLNSWQNRPHGGLRDRLEPSRKLSPNQAYAAASLVSHTIALPLAPDEFIDLLPTEWRVISKTGVHVDNREYDAEALHPLRNTKSAQASEKGKWEVKVDPYNPFAVWVRLPDGSFAECLVRDHKAIFNPHAEDTWPTLGVQADVARQNAAATGTAMVESSLPTTHDADSVDDATNGDTVAVVTRFNSEED